MRAARGTRGDGPTAATSAGSSARWSTQTAAADVKVVSYWLMQPVEGTFEPTPEVDELRWPSLADAVRLLSYSHDRELLESVQSPLTRASE